MNPVTDCGALTDKRRSACGESSVIFNGRCGHPNAGQIIAAQELCQDEGVDLVGLDVGLGDRLGFDRVGDDDLGDARPDQPDERPGVTGDLDGEVISGEEVLGGEAFDRLGGNLEAAGLQRLSIMAENVKRGSRFMKIDADVPGLAVAGTRTPAAGLAVVLVFFLGSDLSEFMAIKLHERLSQGWPPCALSTLTGPVGRIDTYLFELEAQPDWS